MGVDLGCYFECFIANPLLFDVLGVGLGCFLCYFIANALLFGALGVDLGCPFWSFIANSPLFGVLGATLGFILEKLSQIPPLGGVLGANLGYRFFALLLKLANWHTGTPSFGIWAFWRRICDAFWPSGRIANWHPDWDFLGGAGFAMAFLFGLGQF